MAIIKVGDVVTWNHINHWEIVKIQSHIVELKHYKTSINYDITDVNVYYEHISSFSVPFQFIKKLNKRKSPAWL